MVFFTAMATLCTPLLSGKVKVRVSPESIRLASLLPSLLFTAMPRPLLPDRVVPLPLLTVMPVLGSV
ncbi:hypothetical protein D3C84_1085040 [compost metagenome]